MRVLQLNCASLLCPKSSILVSQHILGGFQTWYEGSRAKLPLWEPSCLLPQLFWEERHDQGGESKWQWRQRNPKEEIERNPWRWNEITMDGEVENQTSRARSASRSCQFYGTQFQCRRRGMSKRSCRGGEKRWKDVWTIHSVTNTCGSFYIWKAKQKLLKWLKCDKAQIHT